MAMRKGRPKPLIDMSATMKPTTPGWLAFPMSPRRTFHNSVDVTPGKAKFLSTHHKRAFPLNICTPATALDSYRTAVDFQQQEELFPETKPAVVRVTREKASRLHHRTGSVDVTAQSPVKAELPVLNSRSLLDGRGKSRSRSIDYQDFFIGGNNYNAEATERLYSLRVIRISSRSKIRLYSLANPQVKRVPTAAANRHGPQKSSEQKPVLAAAPPRKKEATEQFDGVTYPLPALNFPDKMYRIKYLVDNAISIN